MANRPQVRLAASSMVYFNYSLPYAIRDLARLGYDGIEFWGGRPHMYRHDLGAVKNQLPHPIIFFSKTDGHMYEV
jgi:sugar phosphate isomerase/epimerase